MGDIDEVKSRLNIIDIIGERVTLKRAGRNFKGLCPFHNEKTPSFMVSPERGSWHCFGCGKGGSVIDFVMEYEHVDFAEALETLALRAGVTLEHRQSESPEKKLKEKIYEVNHLASEYYHYILTSHKLGKNALEYLAKRGVKEQTMKTFMLGYSPNSWDGLKKFLNKKGYDERLLETAGLTIPSSRGGYDRFRGRVMFALRDHRGKVIGFSGRLLDPEIKEAKYINTAETPVYVKGDTLYGIDVTKGAIQKENEAIVMEGEFDVISSFQEGIGNVVAIKGSALTEAHVTLIRRFADKIIFALDADVAGDAASRRGINIAEKAGLELKVVRMPVGKDPDDAVRENPPGFKKAIKEAVPVYDYFIDSAKSRFDTESAFGKKRISDELLPILLSIENTIVQAHYIKKVAKLLDVTEEIITEGIKRISKTQISQNTQNTITAGKKEDSKTRPEKLEVFILALILQGRINDFLEELKVSIGFDDLNHPAVKSILKYLDDYASRQKVIFVKDFANELPKELLPILDEAYLMDLSSFIDNDELLLREWFKALKEEQKMIIHKKINDITKTFTESEESIDSAQKEKEDKLREYTQKLRDLEKSSDL